MKIKLNKKDKKIQEEIIHEANKSLAILGRSFVRHGSGRFIWFGPLPKKRRQYDANCSQTDKPL